MNIALESIFLKSLREYNNNRGDNNSLINTFSLNNIYFMKSSSSNMYSSFYPPLYEGKRFSMVAVPKELDAAVEVIRATDSPPSAYLAHFYTVGIAELLLNDQDKQNIIRFNLKNDIEEVKNYSVTVEEEGGKLHPKDIMARWLKFSFESATFPKCSILVDVCSHKSRYFWLEENLEYTKQMILAKP